VIKFYQNRELSKKLTIRLSKWKRWSREFLPPDPLGGLQSGYARQYSIDDAFTVYLGGYLVSELKFSIPAAKQILEDLKAWMQSHGFFQYYNYVNGKSERSNGAQGSCCIYIAAAEEKGLGGTPVFYYSIKQILSTERVPLEGDILRQDRYLESHLRSNPASASVAPAEIESPLQGARVVFLSNLHQTFLEALDAGFYTGCQNYVPKKTRSRF
jgi:hypothetical protein